MTPRPPLLNSLRARLLIGSGIPLALFVGVALISLSVLYQLLDALGQERHSHQVIVKALEQQDQLDRMTLTVQFCTLSDPDLLKSHYETSRQAFLKANDAAQELARASRTRKTACRDCASWRGSGISLLRRSCRRRRRDRRTSSTTLRSWLTRSSGS